MKTCVGEGLPVLKHGPNTRFAGKTAEAACKNDLNLSRIEFQDRE